MLKKTGSNSKKNAMLARKEQLLQDIKYYELRIQEFPTNTPCFYYEGNNSSDSEDDLPTLDIGPSIIELKQQDHLLRTCLQATQELTGVGVLQSEVNVMVEDPVIEGEKPVFEPGSWREVTAECRIDLVPFSITFYTHQPNRKFAPKSYRSLRVLPVKTAQEAELSNSVLSSLTRPSDAIEVLRSYAVAYRSRRSTLARLADKYANSLFMEPLAEGGFTLKCANLLEMTWRLENQLSTVAAFHHKMNFELEYMDESYLKLIKQTHHQLSDPSLQTDERTLLLAKIISTCLEARGPTQELYESMESDAESIKRLEKTILDEDSDEESAKKRDEQQTHKRKRDAEVMAPPKSIPKKAKPKGKENMDDNRKSVKRSSQVDGHGAKKARIDGTNVENSVTDIVRRENSTASAKNKKKTIANQKNSEKEKEHEQNGTEKAQKQNKNDKIARIHDTNVENSVTDIVRSEMSNVGTKNKKNTAANQKNSEKEKEHVENGTEKAQKQDKINDKSNSKSIDGKSTKLVNEHENASKNKATKVSQGNVKNSDKDITTKKVSKNLKGQVKSTDINKNSVPAKNVNKDIAENNEPTEPNAKKVKESVKSGPQNPKTTKTATNEAENKKTDLKQTKNTEAIEENVGTDVVNTKNGEKNTQSSKAKAKMINAKNSDENLSDPANAKKNVNSNAANAKKSVNCDLTNTKKSTISDPANAKKNVNSGPNHTKKIINSDHGNSKKNSDPANAKTSVRSDPANAKKNVNANPTNAKQSVSSDPGNAKTSISSDPANAKKNVKAYPANAKQSVSSDPGNAKKNANDLKGTSVEITTRISNTANKHKDHLAESNKKSDTEIPKDINVAMSAKSAATSKKNIFAAENTKKLLPKNHPTSKSSTASLPANQEYSKKITLKNHRNSSGKLAKKSIAKNLKPNISNESKGSKIPQKKLSPAYAAVLKQNPMRMSPRVMSKFKSQSHSNIQTKLSKPVTNIPRLLKKPAPKPS